MPRRGIILVAQPAFMISGGRSANGESATTSIPPASFAGSRGISHHGRSDPLAQVARHHCRALPSSYNTRFPGPGQAPPGHRSTSFQPCSASPMLLIAATFNRPGEGHHDQVGGRRSSTRCWPTASGRPTSTTPPCCRPTRTLEVATIVRQRGRPRVDQEHHPYRVARGWTATPASPHHPPNGPDGRNAGWRHLYYDVLADRPTPGSTRGSWPGTSRCTPCRGPTSIPRSPSTSCWSSCAEWFLHPNGALPAYEWELLLRQPAGPRAPCTSWVFHIYGDRDLDSIQPALPQASLTLCCG